MPRPEKLTARLISAVDVEFLSRCGYSADLSQGVVDRSMFHADNAYFLPAARIDDLMVSYAAHGGSVGPHDDRYDVFLLQGPGRRRWQINRGGDRTLDKSAAIKVLASFAAEEDWVLEPGDMLYLPPGVAHYGVAEGPCFTYSIGFLAPSHVELVQSFLGYLGGVLEPTLDGDALLASTEQNGYASGTLAGLAFTWAMNSWMVRPGTLAFTMMA